MGQETLLYDDDTAGGVLPTSRADIELVRFEPAHPYRINEIRIWFTGTPAETDVYVWADYGEASMPFGASETPAPLFETTLTPSVDEWTVITLPTPVEVDPLKNFLVGQILHSDDLKIAHDGSPPAEGDEHSLYRRSGNWGLYPYGDLMIRAEVEYFDVVDTTWFTDVTSTALGGAAPRRVAWGDYDGDGDDDLLVNGPRLWRNDGGTFTDVSIEAGVRTGADERICGGAGGIWADYDNDGHLDFYATSSSFVPICWHVTDGDWYCNEYSGGTIPACLDGYCRNASDPWPQHDCLFHNEGDGTFTVPPEEGMPHDYSPTEGAGWGDFDGDGFVDLYVANYEMPGSWTGGALGEGTPDVLWHNNGDGTFTDVSDAALPGELRAGCRWQSGRGVNWGDYDGDGRIDIFVSNYRLQPNCLWHNLGDGSFEEIAAEQGVKGVMVGGAYGHTIGSQWMDFDSDGDLDLFSANLAHPRFDGFSDKSMLLVNTGAPDYTFANEWASRGFIYQETDSDPAWGDFDNDGMVDIYVTDVYVGRKADLYRQLPDGMFEDVTYESGTAVDNGWGAAWADIDGDGDLDLVTKALYRNDISNDNHWLQVHLEGTDSNRAAIGARVDVTCSGVTRSRQVEGGKGTTSQNSLTLHFGLGDCTIAEALVVTWPSGNVETFEDVDADQRLEIVEASTAVVDEEMEAVPETGPEPSPDASTDPEDDGEPSNGGKGCGCAIVG
jgi:hypothetical protein